MQKHSWWRSSTGKLRPSLARIFKHVKAPQLNIDPDGQLIAP